MKNKIVEIKTNWIYCFSLIFLFSCILFIFCCKQDNFRFSAKHHTLLYNSFNTNKIIGDSLNGIIVLNGDSLRKPKSILSCNNLFVITEIASSHFVGIYDTNFVLVKKICKFGNAPEELNGIGNVSYCKSTDELFVADINSQKYLRINLSNLNYDTDNSIKSHKFNTENGLVRTIHTTNISFATTYLTGENKFAIFDFNNKLLAKIRFDPPKIKQFYNQPIDILHQAFQGQIAFSSDFKNLIYATRYADILEFYNIQDTSIVFLNSNQGPDNIFPLYEIKLVGQDQVFAQSREMKLGYLHVECSLDKYYCLYSGRSRNESIPAIKSNRILVFSLKGEFVKEFILDRYINSFTIKNNSIFAIGTSDNTDDAIIKFIL